MCICINSGFIVIVSSHDKQVVGVASCIILHVMLSSKQVTSIDGLAIHSSCELCEKVENNSGSSSSSTRVITLNNARFVFSSYLHLNIESLYKKIKYRVIIDLILSNYSPKFNDIYSASKKIYD